jgi:hypothetical protein
MIRRSIGLRDCSKHSCNTLLMYGELRSLMVRASKIRLQNDYIRLR